MSIESIFKALEIVDTLSADDFDKFKSHLAVIDSKFKNKSDECSGREIPPYEPIPLRSEINGLPQRDVEPLPLRTTSDNYDPTIPPPPKPPASMSTCSCSSFFGLIPVHPSKCTCRGGK